MKFLEFQKSQIFKVLKNTKFKQGGNLWIEIIKH